MLNLKKVAITGGVSSGKTTVADVFQSFGAYVVSADQITHQFLSSSTAQKALVSLLGDEVLSKGSIDRKKVANLVFQDVGLLRKLEAIIHPHVASEIAREWEEAQAKEQKYPLFVAEVPLLFESGQDRWYDVTVAVVAPEEVCMERFCASTAYDQEEYLNRARLQLTQAEKAKRAKFVIQNNSRLEELKATAKELFDLLVKGEQT